VKQRRIIAAVIAIGSFLLVTLMYRGTNPPERPRGVEGPSTDVLNTSGIFKPGGYVDFEYSPGIESLKGLYKGLVITYALPPDNAIIDEALWPYVRRDFGRDWGRSLSQGSNRSFSVKHRVAIPNDETLAGTKVVFLMRYSLYYPVRYGADNFREKHEKFDEYVMVELSNAPAAPEELAWSQAWEPGTPLLLLMIALLLIGFTAVLYILFPWKSRGGKV
jgi:hypothetical protein